MRRTLIELSLNIEPTLGDSDLIFEHELAFGRTPTTEELDYARKSVNKKLEAEDKKRSQYLIDATWYAHVFDKELSYEQWQRDYYKK